MDLDSAIAGMAKSTNNPVVCRLGDLVAEVVLFWFRGDAFRGTGTPLNPSIALKKHPVPEGGWRQQGHAARRLV